MTERGYISYRGDRRVTSGGVQQVMVDRPQENMHPVETSEHGGPQDVLGGSAVSYIGGGGGRGGYMLGKSG